MAEETPNPKKLKIGTSHPYVAINTCYTVHGTLCEQLETAWQSSTLFKCSEIEFSSVPFRHCLARQFLNDDESILKLEKELSKLKLKSKRNDLFKFKQSNELNKIHYLPNLRSFIEILRYQMLPFISKLTGLELNSEKISLSFSSYLYSNYLLCHDDQLDDRQIAFIYYIVPKSWSLEDGGCLDLFSTNQRGFPDAIQKSILPERNMFVFFEVSQISFHQVSEILNKQKARISLAGWFHADKTNHTNSNNNNNNNNNSNSNSNNNNNKYEIILNPLIDSPIDILEAWINPEYLQIDMQLKIKKKFNKTSEIQLTKFFLQNKFSDLLKELSACNNMKWQPDGEYNLYRREIPKIEETDFLPIVRECLELFRSEPFAILLSHLTGLKLCENLINVETTLSESETNSEIEIESPKENENSVNTNSHSTHTNSSYGCQGVLAKWTPGCYKLLTTNKNLIGFSQLDVAIFAINDDFASEQKWSANFGGSWVYASNNSTTELLRINPYNNSLCLVYIENTNITDNFIQYCNVDTPTYYSINYRYNDKD